MSPTFLRSDIVVLRFGFTRDAVLVAAFAGLGALLLSREPRNRAGMICLTVALIPIADLLSLYADNDLPGSTGAGWVASWIGIIPVLSLNTILILLLLDGRVPHRIWRPRAWLLTGSIVGLTLVDALAPLSDPHAPQNPLGLPPFRDGRTFLESEKVTLWGRGRSCTFYRDVERVDRLRALRGGQYLKRLVPRCGHDPAR
jgi:hypothetical protein